MDTENDNEDLGTDDHDEEGQVEGNEEGAEQVADDVDDVPAKRPSRKERQAQRKNDFAERIRAETASQYQQQIAELTRQLTERMVESNNRVAEAVERVGKQPERPPAEVRLQRVRDKLKRIGENGEGVEEVFQEQQSIMEEIADERAQRAANAALLKYQQTAPKPPPPNQAEFYARAPWLQDPEHLEMVSTDVRRLAKARDRIDPATGNWKSDKLRRLTVHEAITRYAADMKLDAGEAPSLGEQSKPSAAMMGASARGSGAGGNGGGNGVDEMPVSAYAIADIDPAYAHIRDENKRRARWWKDNRPR